MAKGLRTLYKRIILKISGEAFRGKNQTSTFNVNAVEKLAQEILWAHDNKLEIGVVFGGGNIVRGRDLKNIKRRRADQLGMMATVMNALYMQEVLEKYSKAVRMQTEIVIERITPYPYILEKSTAYLESQKIVLFAGGTGNAYCTTDMAAVQRAIEIEADAIFKGTKVDGLYKQYPPARTDKPIKKISYEEIFKLDLGALWDKESLNLLIRENRQIPIHIFNIFDNSNKKPEERNLWRILCGEKIGSVIVPEK